jgi:3',5'-cyclic-AMP phosphodiesterase
MPDMNADLHLLQLTDTHLTAREDGALRGVATRPALRAVLAHARAFHWNAEALLLTGDLVHDDTGGYAAVRAEFGDLGKPVLCLPGNHDEAAVLRRELSAPPFQVGGHADFGTWRVVMLDSSVPGQADGRLSDVELLRLDVALATAGSRHVLVCLHHHPVPQGSRWLDSVALANAADFFAVTDRHACVRAIAWGHVHQAFEGRRHGVRLFGTPSTCAQFLPAAEQFALDPQPPGYRRFTLRADGTIDSAVLRVALPTLALTDPEYLERAAG